MRGRSVLPRRRPALERVLEHLQLPPDIGDDASPGRQTHRSPSAASGVLPPNGSSTPSTSTSSSGRTRSTSIGTTPLGEAWTTRHRNEREACRGGGLADPDATRERTDELDAVAQGAPPPPGRFIARRFFSGTTFANNLAEVAADSTSDVQTVPAIDDVRPWWASGHPPMGWDARGRLSSTTVTNADPIRRRLEHTAS